MIVRICDILRNRATVKAADLLSSGLWKWRGKIGEEGLIMESIKLPLEGEKAPAINIDEEQG